MALIEPVPVTLVVLGAFFYTPPAAPGQEPNDLANGKPTGTASAKDAKQEGSWFKRMMGGAKGGASAGYPGENKAVFVAVMSRMVITPLLLLPLIALIARYDLFEAAEDPVFILSAVLLVSSVRQDSPNLHETVWLTLAAARFDACADHAGSQRRCFRATHLKDHLMVVRRPDASVSPKVTSQ